MQAGRRTRIEELEGEKRSLEARRERWNSRRSATEAGDFDDLTGNWTR